MKSSIALLFLCAGLSIPSLGDPPSPAEHAAEHPAPATFDINFSGGTLSQLLETLSSLTKEPIKVSLEDGAGEIRVPKIKFVGATTNQIFWFLAQMSNSSGGSLGQWIGAGNDSWVVIVHATAKRVVYVGQLLKKYKVEDIAAAITFALNSPDHQAMPAVKLRLHKETSLLIIEATPEDMDTAVEVIHALMSAPGN